MRSQLTTTLALASALLLGSAIAQDSAPADASGAGPLESAVPAVPTTALLLRLRDGGIRWGEIVEHDATGLRFRLLSHGGEVSLPWEFLDPAQEEELRTDFGYVDVTSEELMIAADRLVLTDGREIVGVILLREGPNFLVKVDGNELAIPKRRVTSLTGGQLIPALDVYSREELYGQYLATLDESDPVAQTELAELCERILDFVAAEEHYQAALDLEPTEGVEAIRFSLERAAVKAKQQLQIDFLHASEVMRKRGHFDEALKRLAAFPEMFPGSPLILNAAKQEVRTAELRDVAASKLVQRRWNYWAKRLLRTAAKEMDLDAAQAFAAGELSEQIKKGVHLDLLKHVSEAIPLEAVSDYWGMRRKVRYTTASYGQATWLLGKERANAGTTADPKEAKKAPETAMSKERAAFAEKMKRFQQNQQRAARARGGASDAELAETFWLGLSGGLRANWMFAYYVEFGGDHELRDHQYTPNCSFCGGTGGREVISLGGTSGAKGTNGSRGSGGGRAKLSSGMQVVKCPTCQGIGVTRRIYYR
ncbi:MAG: tetratricopeptide (TPR) repeat protein [Planctomycetota bacterium]|jgi:tetratricopeptide (TPR) repeat protein